MREMEWCNKEAGGESDVHVISRAPGESGVTIRSITCPSCGHNIELECQTGIIQDLPSLPAGVRFDPSDQEILEHLEVKLVADAGKLHPLVDEFIPTLDGDNGICYTHPEKLPGVSKDGQVRHFFHRPSKAYTTGTRKRRKVHSDEDGSETRWHKTGKTRPVLIGGTVKGFKKILVLYTNYGRQKKPEKTNWVMHQYHLGNDEEEKDGETVVSKVFYQTQPRHCGSLTTKDDADHILKSNSQRGGVSRDGFAAISTNIVECYGNQAYHTASFDHSQPPLIPNFDVHGDGSSSLLHFTQMIPERGRFADDRDTDGTAR